MKAIGLFQGDYLASFLLLFGVLLVVVHWSCVRSALSSSPRRLLAAGFAGIVLLLLATAWFDLTIYEAWLTAAKWMRFPFLLIFLLPYLIAEETLLGPVLPGNRGRRLALALSLRLIAWPPRRTRTCTANPSVNAKAMASATGGTGSGIDGSPTRRAHHT